MDVRRPKSLNVVDEYSRFFRAIRMDRSYEAVDMIDTIEELVRVY